MGTTLCIYTARLEEIRNIEATNGIVPYNATRVCFLYPSLSNIPIRLAIGFLGTLVSFDI
jgi:urea transporter